MRMRISRRLAACLLLASLGGLAWWWIRPVGPPGDRHAVENQPCPITESIDEVHHQEFSASTLVITRPCGDAVERPYVVFTSYFGLTDGDYYTGAEPARSLLTPRDSPYFLYGWLARALAREGIASVRYDPIGVRSRQRDGRSFAGAQVVEGDLLRLQRADFSARLTKVIDRADEILARTAGSPVILVGHSGATFTAGDFLHEVRTREAALRTSSRPYGFVGVAAWVDEPTSITAQSKRHFWTRKLNECLRESGSRECRHRLLSHPHFSDAVFDPQVRARVEATFDLGLSATALIQRFDGELAGFVSQVEASKRLNLDGVSLLNGTHRINRRALRELQLGPSAAQPLSCLTQAAALVYGQEDLVLDPEAQSNAWAQACGRASDITVIPRLGHTLGEDAYYGPSDPAALQALVRVITAVAGRIAGPALTPPPAGTSPPASPNSSPR